MSNKERAAEMLAWLTRQAGEDGDDCFPPNDASRAEWRLATKHLSPYEWARVVWALRQIAGTGTKETA